MTDSTSANDFLASVGVWQIIGVVIGLLVAHALLALGLHALLRGARERAKAAARAYVEVQREVWRERAQLRLARDRERAEAGGRAERAARRGALARAVLVGVIAIAATNLSAHGIQGGLPGVGLGDMNTRISVFVVFEGLLALSAGLSWWHQTSNQPGYDRYRVAMWAITGVMAALGWAWSGPVFAIWPLLAAVAWHWVVTAEARRRHGGIGLLGRWREAAAERIARRFRPLGDGDRRRRLARIERRSVRANTAGRPLRWAWKRAFDRAFDAARVRGLLDDATLAELAVGVAARYAGASALAPEAVAHLNPWTAATRASAPESSPARAPQQDIGELPEAARALERARTEDTGPAPAREVEDAPARAHVEEPPARGLRLVPAPRAAAAPAPEPSAAEFDARARVTERLAGPKDDEALREVVIDWVVDYWEEYDRWPTGEELAVPAGVHQSTARRWLKPVRDAA